MATGPNVLIRCGRAGPRLRSKKHAGAGARHVSPYYSLRDLGWHGAHTELGKLAVEARDALSVGVEVSLFDDLAPPSAKDEHRAVLVEAALEAIA